MEKSDMPGCEGPRNGSASTLESAAWRRGLRASLADAALSSTMTTLAGGVFLTGFALALGASQLQIGILAALPTLANVAQIAGSYFIERTGQRKSLCIAATAAGRAMWLAILSLPLVAAGLSGSAAVWCVVLLLAGSGVLAAVSGVAWLSWVRDLVPSGLRGDFFSRRNQVGTALSLSLSILAGLFLDWWEARWPGSLVGFTLVFACAATCGLAAVLFLRAIPEPRMSRATNRQPFGDLVLLPLRDRNFRRVVLFYAYWNVGMNLASPFFNVYMLREMDLPFGFVTLVTVLAGVASLATNRFWVRLSEQFGNKPVVFLATLGNAFFPLWWLFIERDWAWLLLLVHLSGVFNSPLVLGPNNIMLKLAPDRSTSAYLAVFHAVVGPATALAPVLGGLVAGWLAPVHWAAGPVSIGGLKFVFLLSFLGRLTSLLLLRTVVEPDAEPVRHVLRVFRPLKPEKVSVASDHAVGVESPAPELPRRAA
jgi:MFS family permease